MVRIFLLSTPLALASLDATCQTPGIECVPSPTDPLSEVNAAGARPGPAPPTERPPGVAGLTKAECLERLSDREQGFYGFSRALDQAQIDSVPKLQTSVIAGEAAVQGLLERQTAYSSELVEVDKLMQAALNRVQTLLSWETDETQVRAQLRSLFDALQKQVLKDSDEINNASKRLREEIKKMQVSNDKVRQVMTKVADAQTATFRWASAAISKVNSHTKRIAGMGEEVLVRATQVQNMNIVAESLRNIVAELLRKHPEAADQGKKMLESDDAFQQAVKLVASSKTAGLPDSPAANATFF